jgi:hypothetical protein
VKETPEVTVAEAMSGHKSNMKALKILYSTKDEYKSTAKKLGIMDDFKVTFTFSSYMPFLKV